MKLNVGCGPFYAAHWINTDVVMAPELQICPDIVVDPDDPFGHPELVAHGPYSHVYLGHVLEHMPWDQLPDRFYELMGLTEPGTKIMVVGPDTMRVLDRWKRGQEPWSKVAGIIEADSPYIDINDDHRRWEEDRHQWNCHEQRVVDLLGTVGLTNIRAVPLLDTECLDINYIRGMCGWPLVSDAPCQFAVEATVPAE